MNLFFVQAFKVIVTDPDTVLNALTCEVKETGPDGQEVILSVTGPDDLCCVSSDSSYYPFFCLH